MGSQRVRHDWATKDSTAHSRLTMCDIAHEQQRDSAIRIRVSILPQTPLPPTLPKLCVIVIFIMEAVRL